MSSVVDKRFRVTIDKRAREALEIKPGDLAVEHVGEAPHPRTGR